MQITEFTNFDTKEFFYSLNHAQSVPPNFVPASFTLPFDVAPRETCPSGVLNTLDDHRKVMMKGLKEIPNPEPKYSLKRDEWKQPTPFMQTRAVSMALSGHLCNIADGVGDPAASARKAKGHLEELEQLTQIIIRTGPVSWVA